MRHTSRWPPWIPQADDRSAIYPAASSDGSQPDPVAWGPATRRGRIASGGGAVGDEKEEAPESRRGRSPDTSAASRLRMHPSGCFTPTFWNAISACAMLSNAPISKRRVDLGHSMLRHGGGAHRAVARLSAEEDVAAPSAGAAHARRQAWAHAGAWGAERGGGAPEGPGVAAVPN